MNKFQEPTRRKAWTTPRVLSIVPAKSAETAKGYFPYEITDNGTGVQAGPQS